MISFLKAAPPGGAPAVRDEEAVPVTTLPGKLIAFVRNSTFYFRYLYFWHK